LDAIIPQNISATVLLPPTLLPLDLQSSGLPVNTSGGLQIRREQKQQAIAPAGFVIQRRRHRIGMVAVTAVDCKSAASKNSKPLLLPLDL
jgi:hypothetical protein